MIRGGNKIAVDNFVFVEPVIEDKKWIGKTERQHVGIMRYVNTDLANQGIKENDIVAFATDSEYEFVIDDIKLYRIRTFIIVASGQ